MSLAIVLAISFIGIISIGILKLMSKGGGTYTDIEQKVKKAIDDSGYETIVKVAPSINPQYNYELDQISMREGTTVQHLAECFHEFGHAVDAYKKNILAKEYGVWHGLLFYIMKYSLPASIFVHILLASGTFENTYVTAFTYILILLSLIFSTTTLMEEIRATKYGLTELGKHYSLTKKDCSLVYRRMASGMMSYITIIVLSYTTLAMQLYFDFIGQYL